ncbi:hypothetical protein H5410_060350 [Solanum commersonii]|uniref:Uncharacterized protein n=1 Tax=Solanum commersonii TaxID=4109 RepID=A0A9J5W5S7_SOLCO|nr:hypothetical protein H5410_060350 [Solanum commersonii]
MDTIIITHFHHGGKFIQEKNEITYKGENEVEYDGDFLDLYAKHVVDEVEVVTIGFLCGFVVEKNNNVVGEEDLQYINVTAIEPREISNLEEEGVGSNQEAVLTLKRMLFLMRMTLKLMKS